MQVGGCFFCNVKLNQTFHFACRRKKACQYVHWLWGFSKQHWFQWLFSPGYYDKYCLIKGCGSEKLIEACSNKWWLKHTEHLNRYKAPPLTSIVFALLDHGLKEYSTVLFVYLITISLMVQVQKVAIVHVMWIVYIRCSSDTLCMHELQCKY